MLVLPGLAIFTTIVYKYVLNAFPLYWYPERYQFKAEPDFATENILISRRLVPNRLTDY